MGANPSEAAVRLSLGEHVCLALAVEGTDHGWAIGALLAPEGDLGRIWTLSRPLTYRAIEQLSDRGMVTRTGSAPGRGRDRRTIAPTPAGRRLSRRWLGEPVEHLRDIRTELLLKLELRTRAGLPLAPLLDAQVEAIAPTVDALSQVRDPDLVALWRRENARAARRFLAAATAGERGTDDDGPPPEMRLSARNQLHATITGLDLGDVLCTVRARLADGQAVAATVTVAAVEDLDLAEGDEVVVVFKATETLIARAG